LYQYEKFKSYELSEYNDVGYRGGRVYAVRGWDEETVLKWLAVGMCVAMVGMAVMPAVGVGDAVWYYTHSDTMGAAAMGGSAAIIAAGINSAELAGLALAGAVAGGIGAAIVIGL